MSRTGVVGATAAALLSGLLVLTAAPGAQAASSSVKISKIAGKTAPYKKTTRVYPRVSSSGKVQLLSKQVKRAGGGYHSSLALKAGKYTVVTRARYRTYTDKWVKTVQYRKGTTFPTGTNEQEALHGCTVQSATGMSFVIGCGAMGVDQRTGETFGQDVNTIAAVYDPEAGTITQSGGQVSSWTFDDGKPDRGDAAGITSTTLPIDLTTEAKKRFYSSTKSKTLKQRLTIKQGKKPRTCATYADFKRINADFDYPEYYGDSMSTVAKKAHNWGKRSQYSDYGDQVIEFRDYKTCDRDAIMSVGFSDGYAYTKMYWD